MGIYLTKNCFTDTEPWQVPKLYSYPSSHNTLKMNISFKKPNVIALKQQNDYRVIPTKNKRKSISVKNTKTLTIHRDSYGLSNLSTKRNQTEKYDLNRRKNQSNDHSETHFYKLDQLHYRHRRQTSSQNVFHNISSKNSGFFQSSASIQLLSPLDGDSGLFSPEGWNDFPTDWTDQSSFGEFVTEMSDKEFESLGFPVSPKPTESYRMTGNGHDYGMIGSLGDHYDSNIFSGIQIISRELFLVTREI